MEQIRETIVPSTARSTRSTEQQSTSPERQSTSREQHTSLMRALTSRIAPAVLVVLGIAGVVGSFRLGLGELSVPGPGLWPLIISALLTVTAAIVAVTQDPTGVEPWTARALMIVGGLVSLAVFIVLFQLIGFIIPAFLMLLVWLRVFARETWAMTVVLSVVGTAVLYVLFVEALGVAFPEDIVVSMVAGS